MKPQLQTYNDCMNNIALFEDYSTCDTIANGKFIVQKPTIGKNNNELHFFMWFCDDLRHRIDGPAVIYAEVRYWWFYDEVAHVRTQDEFDEWVVRKMMEV